MRLTARYICPSDMIYGGYTVDIRLLIRGHLKMPKLTMYLGVWLIGTNLGYGWVGIVQ